MAQALTALLENENYDVDHFEDGLSALDALESGVYDVIVLDVMMPGMNGFQVAKNARAKGIKTPILMLTAKGETCSLPEIQAEIEERDRRDMTRAEAPLVQAEDAILVDTSDLTIDEVTEKILALM